MYQINICSFREICSFLLCHPYPASANTAEWQTYEADCLKRAFSLDVPVADACADLAGQMNEVLAAEPRAARIKAFQEKRVYQNDNRKGPGGGNDFYESAVTYPEELLKEMSQIFGQNADNGKNVPPDTAQPRWYRNIFNF